MQCLGPSVLLARQLPTSRRVERLISLAPTLHSKSGHRLVKKFLMKNMETKKKYVFWGGVGGGAVDRQRRQGAARLGVA